MLPKAGLGSLVTHAILLEEQTHCIADQSTPRLVAPDEQTLTSNDPAEQAVLAAGMHYQEHESGYSKQQATRPQTLAYGLADSPVGQMAWIIEKYAQWTDCVRDGMRHPENAIERDVLLDIVTYWMTNSGGSTRVCTGRASIRRTVARHFAARDIAVPKELFVCSERLAKTRYHNLVMFNNTHANGGHFASLEQPEAFLSDIRQWHSILRQQEPLNEHARCALCTRQPRGRLLAGASSPRDDSQKTQRQIGQR